jgi:tetratricopeptide (TPR) repeat protein
MFLPRLDLSKLLLNNPNRCMPVKSSARKKRTTRQQARALDLQIQFMEGVVRRDPEYVDALQLLGDHYTQRGKYSQSLKVDERLARLQPDDPLVYYNLACSYSLNRQYDLAVEALEKALNLGYHDLNWLAKDPDLRQLRKHSLFRRIRERIRRMKIKVR